MREGSVIQKSSCGGQSRDPSRAQPSPAAMRMTQPSSTATTDGMGTRRGQIPESFLRQSVPIKVRVTVEKLKQNQELQRSTGDLREGRQEGWGGARGPPRGRRPPPARHAARPHSIQKKPGPVCIHASAYFTPLHKVA
jgi:hypothetical protein